MSATYSQVLIGGGSGFVGRHLAKVLTEKGYGVTIVSRVAGSQRISWDELKKSGLPQRTTAVVSLAGQNVLDPTKRWTSGFKENVWTSRVNTTMALAQACMTSAMRPNVFVSISGVGIYSPSQTNEYTEESNVQEYDFLSQLCHAWEGAANSCGNVVRTVIIRSGVVLGKDGGMIKQLWLPFFLGLGGPVGTGNQYLPWIHVEDLVNLIIFAVENDRVKGILNGVAPDCRLARIFGDTSPKKAPSAFHKHTSDGKLLRDIHSGAQTSLAGRNPVKKKSSTSEKEHVNEVISNEAKKDSTQGEADGEKITLEFKRWVTEEELNDEEQAYRNLKNEIQNLMKNPKISKDEVLKFLSNWREQQFERLQSELKRLNSIEQFMKSVKMEGFVPYVEEDLARKLSSLTCKKRTNMTDNS